MVVLGRTVHGREDAERVATMGRQYREGARSGRDKSVAMAKQLSDLAIQPQNDAHHRTWPVGALKSGKHRLRVYSRCLCFLIAN
jgi:hypothetical protein